MGVTDQYHKSRTKSPVFIARTERYRPRSRMTAMKHTATTRGLGIALSLAAFAVGGSQPGGLNLVLEQMREIGTRQWLELMAGSIIGSAPAIAPFAERIAHTLPTELSSMAGSRNTGTANTVSLVD
jgi:hypothetical protein